MRKGRYPYKSLDEVKKNLLPKLHERECRSEKRRRPDTFGTGLAREVIRNIKEKLKR